MSRKTRRRRRLRRQREHVPEPVPGSVSEREPLAAAEWDRLHQRYARMQGRAITIGYVPIGAVVTATSPAEMVARSIEALVEITTRLPPT